MSEPHPTLEKQSELPKIARDTALAGARISVGLAALCFGLLALSGSTGSAFPIELSPQLSLLIIVLGVLLVYGAALSIDFVVDHFLKEDWGALGVSDPYRYDQIFVRMRLFQGGYFVLSLCMAGLCSAILVQAPSQLGLEDPDLRTWINIGIGLGSGYLFFQMMTWKWGHVWFALIAFAVCMGVVLGSKLF